MGRGEEVPSGQLEDEEPLQAVEVRGGAKDLHLLPLVEVGQDDPFLRGVGPTLEPLHHRQLSKGVGVLQAHDLESGLCGGHWIRSPRAT